MRGERPRRLAYPQADSAQGAIPAPAQRSQRRYLDESCSPRTELLAPLPLKLNRKLFTDARWAARREFVRHTHFQRPLDFVTPSNLVAPRLDNFLPLRPTKWEGEGSGEVGLHSSHLSYASHSTQPSPASQRRRLRFTRQPRKRVSSPSRQAVGPVPPAHEVGSRTSA